MYTSSKKANVSSPGWSSFLQGAWRMCQGEGEETRHEWVPLFAALRLRDDVGGRLECGQDDGAADDIIGRSRIQRYDR